MPAPIPHIRTSERTTFKRCPQQWYWSYREGLAPASPGFNALWMGTGIHLALQERYKYRGKRRGKNVLKVWRDYVGDEVAFVRACGKDEDGEPTEKYEDAGKLGEAMLGAYLDLYGMDERWYVLSAEQTFEIEIPDPRPGRRRPIALYNGAFDLCALDEEEDNSAWIWDHKTAAAIQTRHLSLDDQGGSYWAVAADVLTAKGLLPKGTKLDGMLYNFLAKTKPDLRPVNADGKATNKPKKEHYLAALSGTEVTAKNTLAELESIAFRLDIPVLGDVSAVQPSKRFHREAVYRTRTERRTQIQRIQNEALVMEQFRGGARRKLPLIKTTNKDCSFCTFFQMCELDENGGDVEEYKKHAFVKRDPYAPYRTSTDED